MAEQCKYKKSNYWSFQFSAFTNNELEENNNELEEEEEYNPFIHYSHQIYNKSTSAIAIQ